MNYDTHYELAVCGALVKDGTTEKICINGVSHAYAASSKMENRCRKHCDRSVCKYSEEIVREMSTSGGGGYKSPLTYRDGSWFVMVDKCRFCDSKVVYQRLFCAEHAKTGLKRAETDFLKEGNSLPSIVTADEDDDSYPIKKRSKMGSVDLDEIRAVVTNVMQDEIRPIIYDVQMMRNELRYLTDQVYRAIRHVDYLREDLQNERHH
jgi:hypothetical protein